MEGLTTSQFIVGVKGSLGIEDWTYDLYGLKDDTDSVETIENLSLASRLNQLLQAPDGGISLCEGGFNPFGLAEPRRYRRGLPAVHGAGRCLHANCRP